MYPAQTSEAMPNSEVSAASVEERLEIFPLPLTPLERFLVQCDTRQSSMVMRGAKGCVWAMCGAL